MKGLTLIETIVAIFVFTLAMGAVSGLIVMGYRTHSYIWQQSIAIDEAREGIEAMVKELRIASPGDNGSYPIENAGDKEIIFYSDIDGDGQAERVRYFLATVSAGSQTQKCVSFASGGTRSVTFSNFLQGTLKSAQVIVSVEGDMGTGNEYVEIFADGIKLGNLCQAGCTDCASAWQGTTTFLDITSYATDNSIQFTADARPSVDPNCDWEEPNHSMKAQFEFSWTEEIPGLEHEFKKGVIEPTGSPVEYPSDQEKISIVTSYVRNTPPIFEYFDANGDKIEDYPAKLKDTKMMKVYLVVNVNPNRPPSDFELESFVQLRNLKLE